MVMLCTSCPQAIHITPLVRLRQFKPCINREHSSVGWIWVGSDDVPRHLSWTIETKLCFNEHRYQWHGTHRQFHVGPT